MIRVDVEAAVVRAGLNDLIHNVKDLRTSYRKGAEAARKVEERWFDTEGRNSWADLAERTQEARGLEGEFSGYYLESAGLSKGEGPGHRILHWTHRLRKSVTTKGAKGHVARYEGLMGFRFGTEYEHKGVPVAVFLHHGTRRMPPRPLLDEGGITTAFVDAVREGVKVKRLGMV